LAAFSLIACGGNVQDSLEVRDDTTPEQQPPVQKAPPSIVELPKSETPTDIADSARPAHKYELQDFADDEGLDELKRERELKLCAACNGEWGTHGISQFESCNCRTNDKGKVCRDGNDCQGQCVGDEGESVIVEPGPPALGYFIGVCSEFVTTFGCHRIVRDGASSQLADLTEPPYVLCWD
jgi:hypothetical protein